MKKKTRTKAPRQPVRGGEERLPGKQPAEIAWWGEDMLQKYLEVTETICVVIGSDEKVKLINRKGCQALGYEEQEIVGRNWFDNFLPERLRGEVRTVFRKLMAGEVEPVECFENPVLTRTGEERVIAWHNAVLVEEGDIIATLSSGADVTEQRQAQKAMEMQQDLIVKLGTTANLDEALKLCLDTVIKITGLDSGGIYLVDPVSGSLELVFHQGLSPRFVKQASYYEPDSPNARLVMECKARYLPVREFDAAIAKPLLDEGLRAVAVVPICYDGQVIACLNVASHTIEDIPVDVRMFLEAIAVQVSGIIARIRAEQKLLASEERYRSMLEEMQSGYLETDLAGNFTFCNNATCRYLGYSKQELIGMNYRNVTEPEDVETVYRAFNRVYRTGEPVRMVEFRYRRKDGSTGYCELLVSPLRDGAGKTVGFRVVNRDITERKRMEEEKRQLELKAQVASRLASVGELAAGVAHEINNPLTGVIGYAQLLMEREDLPADIRQDLATINEGAQRVAGIIQRLLTFARQTKPEHKLVNVNQLIENTLALRDYHLRVNNIEVITRLDPHLPETAADPGQLQQVFLNIIVNAETEMKLAHGRGRLTITTERTDNTIKICFQDDGPGIRPEIKDRIFDPFFTTREIGQGTGLGLSLCYGIVVEHKGRIYAESEPGKGATFIVELPVVTAVEAQPAQPIAEQPEKPRRAKILVVDDEPVIREFVARVLADEGYEVDVVANGRDALERIESRRYSLILLDIKIPGISGVELYRRIQEIAKSLARRVVFITGDILSAETERFLAQARVACLEKPFDAEQLKEEVQRALTRRQ